MAFGVAPLKVSCQGDEAADKKLCCGNGDYHLMKIRSATAGAVACGCGFILHNSSFRPSKCCTSKLSLGLCLAENPPGFWVLGVFQSPPSLNLPASRTDIDNRRLLRLRCHHTPAENESIRVWKLFTGLGPRVVEHRVSIRDRNLPPIHSDMMNLANPGLLRLKVGLPFGIQNRLVRAARNYERQHREKNGAHRPNETKMSDGGRERALLVS
jgi:hypothetical protein